jgi:amino acid transporter
VTSPQPELRREIGLRDLILFNVAAVVGIRWLAAAAHVGPGSLPLWVLAALLFFVPSALAVATLGERYPEEGGIYAWTRHAFGPWNGFLCGWCYWLSNLFYFPNLVLAGVGMTAQSAGLSQGKMPIIIASLAVLWVALLANVLGVTSGKWATNIGGLATYAGGLLIVAAGLMVWTRAGSATQLNFAVQFDLEKLNFWSQIALAFGGLELGAAMSGEIRDPRRTVPRAAWIAGLAIALFYIAGTLALLVLLPSGEINILTGLTQAAGAAGAKLGSPWLGQVLVVLILLGVIGQLGAWIGGSARVPFVIGLDRYLPEAFGRIHPRWRTPHIAILSQGFACTVFLLGMATGETIRIGYQLLVDMTVITYFIPFVYLFGAAWKQGRKASAAMGIGVTLAAIGLSAIPPADVSSPFWFEVKIAGGCAALIAAARICFARRYNRVISS